MQKASKAKMPLLDFENRMGHFGDALDSFDTMDEGENSIFAVFDGLVRLRTNTPEARASSLALETTKAGEKRRTMFVLAGEAEKAVAAPLH